MGNSRYDWHRWSAGHNPVDLIIRAGFYPALFFEVSMRGRRSGQGHRKKRKNIKDAKKEGKSLKKFLKDK